MDRAPFEDWLRRYFEAWVTNDPGDVAALFAEDALYWVGPFREPWVGREQIVARWTAGTQEDVRTAFDVVAVEGNTGVAHWNVSARIGDDGGRKEWDGVLVIEFGLDGRCREHREWFSQRDLT
jgi:ketosteroid isomerase-like protein